MEIKFQPAPQNFTSNKRIPRYLYHLTTNKNAEDILRNGTFVNYPVNDDISGLFMFDLKNFLKHWINPKQDLASRLFFNIARIHGESNLTLLKIHVKSLDTKQLKIRSQKYLYQYQYTKDKKIQYHRKYGDFAENQKHYTRKKHPIEYIYSKSISAQNIEKCGECKIKNLFKFQLGLENAKNLIPQLFRDKPEENAVKFWNK